MAQQIFRKLDDLPEDNRVLLEENFRPGEEFLLGFVTTYGVQDYFSWPYGIWSWYLPTRVLVALSNQRLFLTEDASPGFLGIRCKRLHIVQYELDKVVSSSVKKEPFVNEVVHLGLIGGHVHFGLPKGLDGNEVVQLIGSR